MQYLFLLYADESQAQPPAGPEEMAAYLQPWADYTAALKEAGVFVGGEALQDTPTATTIRRRDGALATTDGPFAETVEQLGGYYMVDVPDLDAAMHWAGKCPIVDQGGAVEIRAVTVFG